MSEKTQSKISIEKVKEILSTIEIDFHNPSLIQDNKLIFKVDNDDSIYRCRMPSQRERSEAEDVKNRYYTKLIQEGGYLTRKQLKKLLIEKQDIDINELEIEKLKLQEELKNLYLELAPAMTGENELIGKIKKQIKETENKFFEFSIEISNYLSPSIEDRIEKEYVEYLTYISTEKMIVNQRDKWASVWNTYEDFRNNENQSLEQNAIEALTYLLLNVGN